MAKLTTNPISSILANPVGAATAINVNNALIETAMENTLSLDGTSPNQMEANLDMNSNRILNLPEPIYSTEPLRVSDLPAITGGDIIFEGMSAAVYDPTTVEGDAFDMDNMAQGSTKKYLSAAEYTIATTVRERLSANRTYYVRTDGSDSNTGLADSVGGAFLTWQKAANVIATLDIGGYTVTVQHGAESGTKTFTVGAVISGFVGGGQVLFLGNGATTVISTTSAHCWNVTNSGTCNVRFGAMKLQSTGASGIKVDYNSLVSLSAGIIFGDFPSGYGFWVHDGQSIGQALSIAYTIDGDAIAHIFCQNGGHVYVEDCTITLTGTPDFTTAFFLAFPRGYIQWTGNSYTGTATGDRYVAYGLSLVNLNGDAETELPGDGAGALSGGSIGNHA